MSRAILCCHQSNRKLSSADLHVRTWLVSPVDTAQAKASTGNCSFVQYSTNEGEVWYDPLARLLMRLRFGLFWTKLDPDTIMLELVGESRCYIRTHFPVRLTNRRMVSGASTYESSRASCRWIHTKGDARMNNEKIKNADSDIQPTVVRSRGLIVPPLLHQQAIYIYWSIYYSSIYQYLVFSASSRASPKIE